MLEVREDYVNLTEGRRFGGTEWEPAWTDDRGHLFRDAQKEYGRCESRIYSDADYPVGHGWVFVKRMEYQDARHGESYIREVWVHIREVDDEN